MRAGLIRIVLYLVVICLPLAVAAFLGMQGGGLLRNVGLNFGLLGFTILTLQFVLAARIKWIERPFGLDRLIRFHRFAGLAGLCLVALHPLLLALDGMGWELLLSLDLPWYVLAGKAALFLVITNVLVSLYQSSIGLKFERWRLMHDLAAPAILVLIFVHSWFAGIDLEIRILQGIWIALFLLAGAAFIHHRIIRPKQLKQHPYHVQEVLQETDDVWTVKLTPPAGQTIPDYLPGQFHFLTFLRSPGLPVEEHHWTISSSPAQKDFISSTIKAVGDFTSTIGQTKPGDTAAVHGSFGRFSYLLHPEERDLVFLVGGIGITPVMSMLRHMRDTRDQRSVVLLYANKTEQHIVFHDELAEIADGERPALRLIHVLSRPGEGWQGETGHVDRRKIEAYCGPSIHEKVFYICGPAKMAEELIAILQEMGVGKKRIRREIFSLID